MTLTGRTGTAVLVAAVVSLCLNLLLAGMMIGGHWHDWPGRHSEFWSRIPEDARPIVKGVFEAHKTEFDQHRKAVEQAKLKVAELLKADTIDQAQLDQALDALSRETQAMQQFGHQVMIDIAQKLPPDVRREMADRWAKDRFRRSGEP
jgi:hypothetical protein